MRTKAIDEITSRPFTALVDADDLFPEEDDFEYATNASNFRRGVDLNKLLADFV